MQLRKLINFFLDPWLILGAVGIGVALVVVTLLMLWLTRAEPPFTSSQTAVITVIAAPSSTPIIPILTPTEAVTPVATLLPPPPPGDLAVGAYVQVRGTGGDGLRLRTGPGLDNDVRLLGLEDEVFLVQDGPQQVDGYTWWYLLGPYDETRRGWAVANYLALVQNP